MEYERKYVWSITLRIFHLALMASIFLLIITGIFIFDPASSEDGGALSASLIRTLHVIAGYVLAGALIVRLFLLIFGNKYERISDFIPINARNIKNLFCMIKYYLYLSDEHEERLGHNVLAGISYVGVFAMCLLMIVSGFYLLYPESSFWESIGVMIFGNQVTARLIHHIFTWFFGIFIVIHVYIACWNDIKSKEGLLSSIVSGYKYISIRKKH